ncbi:MAG: hypothetical protein ACOYOV_12465 [Bacteroidales bacterium]
MSLFLVTTHNVEAQSLKIKQVGYFQYKTELPANTYEFIYQGQPKDTISTALHDSVWSFDVFTNKLEALYSNHSITLTKVGSTALVVRSLLLGKYFSTDLTADTLANVYFRGSVTDSTINTKLFTNKLGYNYYQQKLILTSGKCKVTKNKAYYRR